MLVFYRHEVVDKKLISRIINKNTSVLDDPH